MDYLWLALFWILYFILHSVTASTSVKNYVLLKGISAQHYRLFYNLFALISLAPIIIFSSTINSQSLLQSNVFTKTSGLILAGWGVIIAKMGFNSYDLKAFLGLGNMSVENEFRTDGLLKSVRHPVYAGSILLIMGYFLYNPKISSLISASMLITYLLVGIRFEERKLIRVFGDKYIDYKRKTPMLIPRFWKKS